VIMIVKELWVFYGLTQAEVTVECNGGSTLNMALDTEQKIGTQMMDHALLFVIRAAVTRFPIVWRGEHVKDTKIWRNQNRS